MHINAETQLNMVIGYPLTHTKSPQLHNAIYKKYHINARLLAFSNPSLICLVESIKHLNVGLTAVTMPYKEKILEYIDEISVEVKTLNAVNTIIQKNGKLWGYNTDVDGIAHTFRNIDVTEKKVLILGGGGAASAAGFFFNKENAHVFWHNRTASHLKPIIQRFGGQLVEVKDIEHLHFDIIINTTPLGLYPNSEQTPLPNFKFQQHHIVFDMVYNPVETTFLKNAKLAGAHLLSGLTMFIGQGLRQIELWLDMTLPQTALFEEIKIAFTE